MAVIKKPFGLLLEAHPNQPVSIPNQVAIRYLGAPPYLEFSPEGEPYRPLGSAGHIIARYREMANEDFSPFLVFDSVGNQLATPTGSNSAGTLTITANNGGLSTEGTPTPTADSFAGYRGAVTGNFDIVVNLFSHTGADYCQAHLQVRESEADYSRFISFSSIKRPTGEEFGYFHWRATDGGAIAVAPAFPAFYTPVYLRLIRVGNNVSAYWSNAASLPAWYQIGPTLTTVDLPEQVVLFLSASTAGVPGGAVFDTERITGKVREEMPSTKYATFPEPDFELTHNPFTDEILIEAGGVGGAVGPGTPNYLSKFITATSIGDSPLEDVTGDIHVHARQMRVDNSYRFDSRFTTGNLAELVQVYNNNRVYVGPSASMAGSSDATGTQLVLRPGTGSAYEVMPNPLDWAYPRGVAVLDGVSGSFNVGGLIQSKPLPGDGNQANFWATGGQASYAAYRDVNRAHGYYLGMFNPVATGPEASMMTSKWHLCSNQYPTTTGWQPVLQVRENQRVRFSHAFEQRMAQTQDSIQERPLDNSWNALMWSMDGYWKWWDSWGPDSPQWRAIPRYGGHTLIWDKPDQAGIPTESFFTAHVGGTTMSDDPNNGTELIGTPPVEIHTWSANTNDISGTNDDCFFTHWYAVRNGDFIFRLVNFTGGGTYAKAGAMVRDANKPDDRMVFVGAMKDGTGFFTARTNWGEASWDYGFTPGAPLNFFIKLEVRGTRVSAFWAPAPMPPTGWIFINTVEFAYAASEVGVAIASNGNVRADAYFDSISWPTDPGAMEQMPHRPNLYIRGDGFSGLATNEQEVATELIIPRGANLIVGDTVSGYIRGRLEFSGSVTVSDDFANNRVLVAVGGGASAPPLTVLGEAQGISATPAILIFRGTNFTVESSGNQFFVQVTSELIDATPTVRGAVNITTQSFGGYKNFTNGLSSSTGWDISGVSTVNPPLSPGGSVRLAFNTYDGFVWSYSNQPYQPLGVFRLNGLQGQLSIQFGSTPALADPWVEATAGGNVIKLHVPDASQSTRGLVSLVEQGFAGRKHFGQIVAGSADIGMTQETGGTRILHINVTNGFKGLATETTTYGRRYVVAVPEAPVYGDGAVPSWSDANRRFEMRIVASSFYNSISAYDPAIPGYTIFPQQPILRFEGPGVTVTNNNSISSTIITIAGGAAPTGLARRVALYDSTGALSNGQIDAIVEIEASVPLNAFHFKSRGIMLDNSSFVAMFWGGRGGTGNMTSSCQMIHVTNATNANHPDMAYFGPYNAWDGTTNGCVMVLRPAVGSDGRLPPGFTPPGTRSGTGAGLVVLHGALGYGQLGVNTTPGSDLNTAMGARQWVGSRHVYYGIQQNLYSNTSASLIVLEQTRDDGSINRVWQVDKDGVTHGPRFSYAGNYLDLQLGVTLWGRNGAQTLTYDRTGPHTADLVNFQGRFVIDVNGQVVMRSPISNPYGIAWLSGAQSFWLQSKADVSGPTFSQGFRVPGGALTTDSLMWGYSTAPDGSYAEKLRIVGGTGFVGIGGFPSAKLDVFNGSIKISGTPATHGLIFADGTVQYTAAVGGPGGAAQWDENAGTPKTTYYTPGSQFDPLLGRTLVVQQPNNALSLVTFKVMASANATNNPFEVWKGFATNEDRALAITTTGVILAKNMQLVSINPERILLLQHKYTATQHMLEFRATNAAGGGLMGYFDYTGSLVAGADGSIVIGRSGGRPWVNAFGFAAANVQSNLLPATTGMYSIGNASFIYAEGGFNELLTVNVRHPASAVVAIKPLINGNVDVFGSVRQNSEWLSTGNTADGHQMVPTRAIVYVSCVPAAWNWTMYLPQASQYKGGTLIIHWVNWEGLGGTRKIIPFPTNTGVTPQRDMLDGWGYEDSRSVMNYTPGSVVVLNANWAGDGWLTVYRRIGPPA